MSHGPGGDGSSWGATPTAMEQRLVAAKYRLVRLLGQGGMGAVYEAKHQGTLKRCAVKLLLSPDLAAHPKAVKRFLIEAKASSVIESDHVVEVYDSGIDSESNYPYMVMELLRGEDVEHVVSRLGALHPRAAAKIVLQAATGLAKAHELEIVHRDVKSANLFATRRDAGDLVIKVLDFGIAKVKMEQLQASAHGLTRTGSLLGTPLYMSPEQAEGIGEIDARSDVWSLGVVLFELLSGRTPFAHSRSLGELMVNIMMSDVPLIQDRAPWVEPELARIVHTAMSRDLGARYRNAGELRDALAAWLGDGARLEESMLQSVPAELATHPEQRFEISNDAMLRASHAAALSATQSAEIPRRARSGLISLAIGAALLVTAGVAWLARSERSPSAGTAPDAAAVPAAVLLSAEPSALEPAVLGPFRLEIVPAAARVRVDGEPVDLVDGGIALSGNAGAIRQVQLELDGRTLEQPVAVTASGLVPRRLELGKTADKTRPRKDPVPAASAAPPTPAASTPPAAKQPKVEEDTKEFGN